MTGDFVVVNEEQQTMPNASFADLMKAVLDKGVPFRFQARGSSMVPFIRSGDVITIAPLPTQIRLGDVVAFLDPLHHKLAVHRVVQIRPEGVLIQGDNKPEPDGCVPRAAILGRVIQVEHRGKPFRFGLGHERVVIAALSRRRWLIPLLAPIQRLYHIVVKG